MTELRQRTGYACGVLLRAEDVYSLLFETTDVDGRPYGSSEDFQVDGPVDALLHAMELHYPLPTVRWAIAAINRAAKLRGWRMVYGGTPHPAWVNDKSEIMVMYFDDCVSLTTVANGIVVRHNFPLTTPVVDFIALMDEHYPVGGGFDLVAHIERQRLFSERTFGPGARTAGVCDHIRKELKEIEAAPADLEEWIDVVMLALDGAWRTGTTSSAIAEALATKLAKNEARTWPDWRTAPEGKAIEHVR
jgi:hypothetical protein